MLGIVAFIFVFIVVRTLVFIQVVLCLVKL